MIEIANYVAIAVVSGGIMFSFGLKVGRDSAAEEEKAFADEEAYAPPPADEGVTLQ